MLLKVVKVPILKRLNFLTHYTTNTVKMITQSIFKNTKVNEIIMFLKRLYFSIHYTNTQYN